MRGPLLTATAIGLGGFVGALARYGLIRFVHRLVPPTTFPYGTLAVNLVGCLIIGFLTGLADSRQLFAPEVRAFALVGLLGGFTTFSTFGYETLVLIRHDAWLQATANVGVHVVVGLVLVWVGYTVSGAR